MASSYSTDLKLEIQVTGENAGTWGDITNTNLTILQQAIAGYTGISIAGAAGNTDLTFTNGALSNGKNAVIELTGTITGNRTVTITTASGVLNKTYIIRNSTSGAYTVQVLVQGQTGVTFSTTDKGTKILYVNGTDVIDSNIGKLSNDITPTLAANLSTNSKNIIINDGNFIGDQNSHEQIKFATTASAVNEISVTNAATGNAPAISATGGDTNVGLTLTPKGTGRITANGEAKIFGVFEISSDAFLSKASRIVNTFQLIASPHILSRGNTAFSIRVCFIPCLDKNIEAEQPAGPAPEIIISENSSLNSKAAKKMKRSMLFLLNFFCS